ncbi:MAG: box helicase [Myxococcaceae bacterium]|nr:box helicase [Myxococcaceae bacterium]
MVVKAVFFGVNEYASPDISNLSGAAPDAVLLAALFRDSVVDADVRCLTDTRATIGAVSHSLRDVLDGARSDHDVYIAFSGHGTKGQRLVLHDSVPGQHDSFLSLQDLAGMFRRSAARTIVVLLDCCFSGAAPARVFEPEDAPEELAAALSTLGGSGRIILAASSPTEAAFESRGHGLLTRAFTDVLLQAVIDLDAGEVMSRVMARIRADAARLREQQTPVALGLFVGGLILPKLTHGAHFAKAFPERTLSGSCTTFSDLGALGLPDEITSLWAERYPDGLNSLQQRAINHHRVLEGRNLLAIGPTGSGKTLVGEMASVRVVASGQRAVFLVPFKALANEKLEEFADSYGPFGYRVIRCTGDSATDDRNAFLRGKYEIAFLTYEAFLGLALAQPEVLSQVGLVVVDEAHFIADEGRGIVVELLLALVLRARDRDIEPQLIALSAVIGGVNGFDRWLGAECRISSVRPVPLVGKSSPCTVVTASPGRASVRAWKHMN